MRACGYQIGRSLLRDHFGGVKFSLTRLVRPVRSIQGEKYAESDYGQNCKEKFV